MVNLEKLKQINIGEKSTYRKYVLCGSRNVEFLNLKKIFGEDRQMRHLHRKKNIGDNTNVEKFNDKVILLDIISVDIENSTLLFKCAVAGSIDAKYLKSVEMSSKYLFSKNCQLKFNLFYDNVSNSKTFDDNFQKSNEPPKQKIPSTKVQPKKECESHIT